MARIPITRRTLAFAGVALLVFGGGLFVGTFVPSDGPRAVASAAFQRLFGVEPEEEPAEPHEDHEPFVELDERQIANLELEQMVLEADDEAIEVRMPGRIVERPGFSNLAVASTVTGVVTRVHVVPGQAVRPGDPLVNLKLTGESLASAQSALLRDLAELEAIQKEVDRLEPLVDRGSVPGNKLIQQKYDREKVQRRIRVHRQELGLYGLTATQVQAIVDDGTLVSEMVVRIPESFVEDVPTTTVSTEGDSPSAADDWRFTIEKLEIHPGQSIRPGDALAHLAHHTELFVEGWAYENESHWVEELEERHWKVALETGTEGHEKRKEGLDVLYLDNHVDEETRTYGFYVRLPNKPILPDRTDGQGTVFRTWLYKPGQLVHVLVPRKKLPGVFTVPLAALADEGLETYVFVKGRTRHGSIGDRIVEKWRFEPVRVRVLHRSSTHAYLEPTDDLKPGRTIAANKAHLLLLATKEDTGGGGHDHHGHAH